MMRDAGSRLEGFLRRVRARMVGVRAVEWAGVGGVTASGVALAALPVLIWHGVAPLPVAVGLIACGVLAGVVAALGQGCDLETAAREADRRLNLQDLLGSAWSVRQASDGWSRAVWAMAEARCATLTPREVVLVRLGARSWMGIVGAMAVALVAAGVYSLPAATLAGDGEGGRFVAIAQVEQAEQALPPRPVDRRWSSPAQVGAEPEGREIHRGAWSSSTEAGGENISGSQASSQGEGDGAGGGEARTPGRTTERHPAAGVKGERATGEAGGLAAAGSGEAADAGEGRAMDEGTSSGTSARRAPAWETAGWPEARTQAEAALRSGAVPDRYRRLVRDYFERDATPGG